MTPPTKSEPSEDERRLARERGRLLTAYVEVFGSSEATRTAAQSLVMADMEARGYIHRTTLIATGKDGHSDAQFNASAEGQRLFVLNTLSLIRAGSAHLASISGDEPKPTRKKPIMNQST
jgi:hypothetical protein